MAIQYVGGQGNGILGSTTADEVVTFSLAGGLASTPANGDLVVITVVGTLTGEAGVTSLVTGGYTSLTRITSDDSNDTALQVHYKRMGGSPDTDVTITRSGSTASGQAYTIHVFRGVDSGSPMDVTPVPATGNGTSRPNPGPITPVTTGAWIYIGTGGSAGIGSTFTYSAFTNVLTFLRSEGDEDAIVGSGYNTTWVSGAFNPAVSSTGSTATTASWAAYTLALRPTEGEAALDSDAAATMTWGGRSTAASRFDQDATAAVTWNGRSFAASRFDQDATASLTWVGQGPVLAAAAFDSDATASVTWNGAIVAAGAFDSDAAALLTWNGRSTAGAGWTAAATASVTWNGASRVAATLDADAAASLVWNGASLFSSNLSAITAASLTWNGEAVADADVEAAWASAAAASVTWGGTSTVEAALTSTAVASVSWQGTGIFPGAVDISATALQRWNGAALAGAGWSSIVARAVLIWGGEADAASSWSSVARVVLTWNGVSTAGAAWDAGALTDLQWIEDSQGAPVTSDGDWSSTATALAEFTGVIIASAAFGMEATSSGIWLIPKPKPRVIDGRRLSRVEDSDEEDIMLFMAAVNTYLDQDHDNY